MIKVPKQPQHTDNIVLAQLGNIRSDMTSMREMVTRLMELVGRSTTESSSIRSDLASLRAELAHLQSGLSHLQSDIVLLENQNISRHGETMNLLQRLEPVERVIARFAKPGARRSSRKIVRKASTRQSG